MHRTILPTTIFLFAVSSAVSPALSSVPVPPSSFEKTGKTDESGMSWRETGRMKTALTNAVEELKASFGAQGYEFAYDIARAPDDPRHILFWSGATNDLLAMVWRVSDVETGVRWGLSPRADFSSGTAPDPAGPAAGSEPATPSVKRIPAVPASGAIPQIRPKQPHPQTDPPKTP